MLSLPASVASRFCRFPLLSLPASVASRFCRFPLLSLFCLLITMACPTQAQRPSGGWVAVPCDGLGNILPAPPTDRNGMYIMDGVEGGQSVTTYPRFKAIDDMPLIVYPRSATPRGIGTYGSGSYDVQVYNGSDYFWYGTVLGTTTTALENGSVVGDFSGQLFYHFKEVWQGSGLPTTPMPNHVSLLLQTDVWVYVSTDYRNAKLNTGLSASAWAKDGPPFNEVVSATTVPVGSSSFNPHVGGPHLIAVPVDTTTGISQVVLDGAVHMDAANGVPYGVLTHPVASYPSYVQGDVTNGPTGAISESLVACSVRPANEVPLNAVCLNKDLPVNTTYQALPNPVVVYGGSVRSTSDELLLNAANAPAVPGTTYNWYAYGPASSAAYPTTSTWNVVVSSNPGLTTFVCIVQPPGGAAAITKSLTVEVGIRTDDTILVGWIDRNGVPINPANVDAAILADLPPNGGTLTNVAGTARLAALADNNDCLDYLTCTMPYTQVDKDYILDWMFHFADNPDPTPVLTGLQTPDATDPSGRSTTPDLTTYAGYMNFPKLADYMSDFHRFKLLNHFQVKYRVNPSNTSQFNGAPVILQRGAYIGATVNPTGVPPDLGPTLNALASLPPPLNQPFLAAAYLNHTLLDPQTGPANGIIGPVPATNHISQINDGSPEIPGIRAFNTLTAMDEQTPLFWQNIGSKITFKCGATAPVPINENYPTYYLYQNGSLILPVFKQAKTPNGHFYASPYPFGTDISYGLPPRGPGDIPLIPGIPSFPSMNGGRNGIATAPPDDFSVAIPPYTLP